MWNRGSYWTSIGRAGFVEATILAPQGPVACAGPGQRALRHWLVARSAGRGPWNSDMGCELGAAVYTWTDVGQDRQIGMAVAYAGWLKCSSLR